MTDVPALTEPRSMFVYRLVVEYPEGSDAPGWEPEGWEPEWFTLDETAPFRWPRVRSYFSLSGATARARLFARYGANVTIERSAPVDWSEPNPVARIEAIGDAS